MHLHKKLSASLYLLSTLYLSCGVCLNDAKQDIADSNLSANNTLFDGLSTAENLSTNDTTLEDVARLVRSDVDISKENTAHISEGLKLDLYPTATNVTTEKNSTNPEVEHLNDAPAPSITDVKLVNISAISIDGNSTPAPGNITSALGSKPDPKPGAKQRGIIVFGSLGLFCVAYLSYKLYKKRKHARDNDNIFYQNDLQQFKYGVLTSNDQLEMSNLPLTGDSDEEEEMEIFDLEQRKYLNRGEIDSIRAKDHLLVKDDVEIVDLELPGTSQRDSLQRAFVTTDDDLLDLGEKTAPSSATFGQSDPADATYKSGNANDFFDVL